MLLVRFYIGILKYILHLFLFEVSVKCLIRFIYLFIFQAFLEQTVLLWCTAGNCISPRSPFGFSVEKWDSVRMQALNPNVQFSFHFRSRAAEVAVQDENRLLGVGRELMEAGMCRVRFQQEKSFPPFLIFGSALSGKGEGSVARDRC